MADMNDNDQLMESYIQQLRDFDHKYRKLERKYNRLQEKNQVMSRIISKQNKRISRLRGDKQHFVNEPRTVRKAKGKVK